MNICLSYFLKVTRSESIFLCLSKGKRKNVKSRRVTNGQIPPLLNFRTENQKS